MNRACYLLIAIIILSSFEKPAHAGQSFDFSFFRFTTITQDRSGPSAITDVERISLPQNPIATLQDTSLSNSFARTELDVAWQGFDGNFNALLDHFTADEEFRSSFQIDLDFTASVDLIIDVTVDLDYVSSAADRGSFLGGTELSFADEPNNPLFAESFRGGADIGQPPVGTFAVNEQHILPAGEPVVFNFFIRSESQGLIAPLSTPLSLTGPVNISIRPVPEPHTACLLLLGSCLVGLRRRTNLKFNDHSPSP